MPYEQQLNTTDTQRGQRIAQGPANEPIGTLLKELPGVEANIQKDSPVPGMVQQGDDKMKALYDFDREIENRQASPVAEQAAAMYGPEYMTNPAIYEGSASRSMVDQGKSVSDLWDTISKFKTMEGSTLSTAMGLLSDLLKDKRDNEMKEKDRLEGVRQFEETMKFKREGGDLSLTERTLNQALSDLERDAKSGMTDTDLLRKYPNLNFNQVIDAYNKADYYGPSERSVDELREIYEGKGLKDDLLSGLTPNKLQSVVENSAQLVTLVDHLNVLNTNLESGEYGGNPVKRLSKPLLEMGIGTKSDKEFFNLVNNINNVIIYLRSGKQINESEYDRLKNTMAQVWTLNGSNIDRVRLLMHEFNNMLSARGMTPENIKKYFPNSGQSRGQDSDQWEDTGNTEDR